MAQHFLLSAAARTLSLKAIFREGEEAAYRRFRRLRWPETEGAENGGAKVDHGSGVMVALRAE